MPLDGSPVVTWPEYPRLKPDLTAATLAYSYHLRKNLDAGLRWWYEKWDDDRATDIMMKACVGDANQDPSSDTSFFPGGNFRDYEVHSTRFFVPLPISISFPLPFLRPPKRGVLPGRPLLLAPHEIRLVEKFVKNPERP